ncbi:MAG: Glu-tRNA(Gln) amidotransferase subunit GatE [Thermoplasmatota archaeon]
MDHEALGLRIGLEIHRQLKGRKLFCGCQGQLEDRELMRIRRKLGLSRSERGELDAAALKEMEKMHWIEYSITTNSCLVEIDEEPPHMPDEGTVEGALMVSMLLGCTVPNEVLFMRKIVVDGSNPSGFQRTAIVGIDGSCTLPDGSVIGISSVCLEEDAARIIGSADPVPTYRLDRLGIPEVEISTSPDIRSPSAAREFAAHIGELLRSTRRVRRGLGTIRQDLNVSIDGGSRVEIKLVQDLDGIPELVTKEAVRQMHLLEIARDLAGTVRKEDLELNLVDITKIFENTGSRVLSTELKKGGVILGQPLEAMGGFLGTRERQAFLKGSPLRTIRRDIDDVKRLGPELASHARIMAGVKGLFHSDELPDYGISEDEVNSVYSILGLDSRRDAFILVCAPLETAEKALKAAHARALQAFEGIPGEVRKPIKDGRTEYLRPLPGAARMYPETDIPPITVDHEELGRIMNGFPEPKEALFERLAEETGLQMEIISQLYRHDLMDRFEELLAAGADPRPLSRLLINIIPGLLKEGENGDMVSNGSISKVIGAVESGKVAKEAMDMVMGSLIEKIREGESEEGTLDRILDSHRSEGDIEQEVGNFISELVLRKREFITERGERSVGPLMGEVMKVYRGKVDGKLISELLSREISRRGCGD